MKRDRWLALGIIGAVQSCLVRLTPVVAIARGAGGLGAWGRHLGAMLLPVLGGSVVLIAYRPRIARRRAP